MSSERLESVVQRALGPSAAATLDEPTLACLTAQLEEEVSFLRECPGSMTGAQVLSVLTLKLEETLLAYELAKSEEEGREICARVVVELKLARIVELHEAHEDQANSSAASSTASAALLAESPPLLSAPVRIGDIPASALAAEGGNAFVSMSQLQRANQRWSAEEERVLFQSLAESKESAGLHGADEGEEEECESEGGCEMCKRQMPLTRHHLIPRLEHKHGKYATMDKDYLNRCALICRPCHSAVHSFEDEKTLAARFNTIELLLADERVIKWVAYISKQRVNRTIAEAKSGAKGLHYGK